MCNGLNYTKLNRRLTDIKSDREKLVGKRILHTITINLGYEDTMKRAAPLLVHANHPHKHSQPLFLLSLASTSSSTIGGAVKGGSLASPSRSFYYHPPIQTPQAEHL